MISKEEALERLKQEIINANLPLKESATNIVFGKGNPDAAIMFIGEAAGRQEDLTGKPFVGAAGKLLDQLLKDVGLNEKDVYIANILKYRPPNNREPSEHEIRTHTPYLIKQIQIVKPQIIVPLGNYATKFILAECHSEKMDKVPGISSVRGKLKNMRIEGIEFKVIPTFHPAALIYNRALRPLAEQDFKRIKEELTQKSLTKF
jgi:DNA polymerase